MILSNQGQTRIGTAKNMVGTRHVQRYAGTQLVRRIAAQVSVILFLFSACADPYTGSDDAIRDIDRSLPAVDEITATVVNEYNTRPTWSWNSDPVEGTGVFRYRINGRQWVVLVGAPGVPGSYSPGDEDIDLYPGTYLFEVQERNPAGNWSSVCSHTTVIRVREPMILSGPSGATNNPVVAFSWASGEIADPPGLQFGATGLFSWLLETDVAGKWIAVDGMYANDIATTEYITPVALTDGLYRFGVAERNAGGARSLFFHAAGEGTGDYLTYRVDTIPPNQPSGVQSPDLKGPIGYRYVTTASPTFTWNSGGPDGIGRYEYRINGGPVQPGEMEEPLTVASVTLPDLGLGESYSLEVREFDLAGNVSAWSQPLSFSVPQLTGRLMYAGAPLGERARGVDPGFSSSGSALPFVYDAETSEYAVFVAAGATHGITASLNAAALPASMPGNYTSNLISLTIPADAPLVHDFALRRIIRLLTPHDNSLITHAVGTYPPHASPVTFSWEPLPEADEYRYTVFRFQTVPYESLGVFVPTASTDQLSVTFDGADLPVSEANQHYQFTITARRLGVDIGQYRTTYTNGFSLDYRFVVE